MGTDEVRGESGNIFGTSGSAQDHFVAVHYRHFQKEALRAIEEAFEAGYQTVLLEAPTGSGKSHIARALAFQSGSAHIITPQKVLQDQYERDFSDMYVMMGRGAYQCVKPDALGDWDGTTKVTCAKGPCTRSQNIAREQHDCPYRLAKRAAEAAPVTVHNFDSFYYQTRYGHAFQSGRKLMIVDECQNTEGKLLDFMGVSISNRKWKTLEIPRYEEFDEYVGWLVDTLAILQAQHDWLIRLKEAEALSQKDSMDFEEVRQVISRIQDFLERHQTTEYVVDYENKGDYQSVLFRPVFVGDFGVRNVFNYGERQLFMSATILDKDMFCEAVGLKPDRVKFIRVPSVFPPENHRIVYAPAGSMKSKHIEESLPEVMRLLEKVLAKHPTQKGIVQTHSERIAQYIKANLRSPRLTFNKDYETPMHLMEAHQNKPGSVIVASGLREGIDLSGDLSEFQVFCKVPWANIGDSRVARKMKLTRNWYEYQAALSFVQALGRSVRSPTDKATTYLLDTDFKVFFYMVQDFLPPYVRKLLPWRG